ncbi:histidine phosphatase family protein [Rarobacter incanus]|uniref:Broad specificity phosphatase PhoE n=1 Tax=Rarobacter incanus TaxID=153494 RepID=A0A542SMY1_9MICO|nr:histidine phosphatase family protein [Rarobacter incanus]TQK75983.1 broad specificity phosphatase PhoE [Rarobacter incanus]
MMPNDLVLVRHGQSEANIVQSASKRGDDSFYENSEQLVTLPDRSWRLTPQGVAQAQQIGRWLVGEFGDGFDRYIVSPYVRTRETAGNLRLSGAWELNRSVRERDWGVIGTMAWSQFIEERPRSYALREADPLYWAPEGGESIADVAENRVRNLLSTLHRESSGDKVIVVSHGEFIWATRLVLQRWSDERFVRHDKDPAYKIHNCHVFHYTRLDPVTGEQANRLRWVRSAYPVQEADGTWGTHVSEWQDFARRRYTDDDLLGAIAEAEHLLAQPDDLCVARDGADAQRQR